MAFYSYIPFADKILGQSKNHLKTSTELAQSLTATQKPIKPAANKKDTKASQNKTGPPASIEKQKKVHQPPLKTKKVHPPKKASSQQTRAKETARHRPRVRDEDD